MGQKKCSDQLALSTPMGPTGSEGAAGNLQGLGGAANFFSSIILRRISRKRGHKRRIGLDDDIFHSLCEQHLMAQAATSGCV